MIRADARPEQLRYEDRNLLPTDRAARMTASGDGKQIAFGWLCFHDAVKDFPQQKNIVSVWSVDPNARRWTAAPSRDLVIAATPK
jgi:hypothetical protein